MNNSKIVANKISRNTKRFKNIIYKERITSTNDFALNLLKSGFKQEIVILANEQTNGRGKDNTKFISPSNKGIYMSLILKCDLDTSQFLFAVISIAIVKALEIYKIKANIKWPNDILINQNKVCGILIESICNSKGLDNFSVVGIGMNIYNTKDEICIEETNFASSLNIESNVNIDINNLISEILLKIESTILEKTETIINEYEKHLIKNYSQMVNFKGNNILCEIEYLDEPAK